MLAHEWINELMPTVMHRLKLRSQTTGDGSRNYKVLKLILQAELNELSLVSN